MHTQAVRAVARKRQPHLLMGCAVLGLALAPAGPAAVAAAAGLAAAAAVWLRGSAAAVVVAVIVLGAASLGALRLAAIDRPAAAAPPGSAIDAVATLLERPRAGLFGSSAPMKIETGPAHGLRILARRNTYAWPATAPGTRFRLHGFVAVDEPGSPRAAPGAFGAPAATGSSGRSARADSAAPSEANAGEPGTPGFGPLPARTDAGADFDYAAFLRSRGIGREVRVEALRPSGRRGGIVGVVDAMRRRAEAAIATGLAPDQAALARGMVLGEDGDVSADTRDDFRRSGLAHLLAASGQNVALLLALALPLLALAGAAQRVRVGVLLPLVALYVALAGSGASVLRAGVMAAASLFALAVSRRSSAVYSLLLAAAVTLALNPRASGDPGWQLSFAAVAGMLALAPVLQPSLSRLPRPLAEAAGATLAATLATSPLLAHQFGAVSLAALPANLLAFPAVAPVMWIGMSEIAIEQVAALAPPVAPIVHALEQVAAPVSALALRWVATIAARFADPAWAQRPVYLSWPAVIACWAATAAAAFLASSYGRRALRGAIASRLRPDALSRGPLAAAIRAAGDVLDWLRALSPASRRAFAAPVVALAVAAGARAAAPPAPPRHLTVDFIDVGQGDSTLIRDSSGAAVLFDGGVPEARVDRTLRRLGVRKLSVVVATHQSRDHHGGLLQVVKRFHVGLFLDGRDGVPDASFVALEREVDRRRIPRRPTRAGERLQVGAIAIRILWPPPRTHARAPTDDPNERATVAIVSEGDFDLLLSADAESPVLQKLQLPRVEAMKVPHHGSADPGLAQVLTRLRPALAAVEAGRGNRYGHPRRSTLDSLRARVPHVYRTDRDGTIELTIGGGRIAIHTHR